MPETLRWHSIERRLPLVLCLLLLALMAVLGGFAYWELSGLSELPVVRERAGAVLVRLCLFAGAILLVGFGLAWRISRRITSPLRAITAGAKAIAGGDYARRIPTDQRDELGILAHALNTMASEVEGSLEKLEQQVALRTARLQEALQELSEAQETVVRKERLAALGELSSGIGHELRNPLGVIHNAIYILRARGGDVITRNRYLEVMEGQVKVAEKIIGDLVDVARVRSPVRRRSDVVELIREQVAAADLPGAVRFEYDFQPELPEVEVDPVQAGQVILSLLVNAAQAMEGEGVISISARSAGGDAVEIRVADSGPGVSEDRRDQIFEPLFTTKASGIGLGLPVSRSLARANGGELELVTPGEPAPGGATFGLTLPSVGQASGP